MRPMLMKRLMVHPGLEGVMMQHCENST